jgi:hypothetical protein
MPIAAPGKITMQTAIKNAFITAKERGSEDGANPDAIIERLSSDIANAVDAYVTSITVTINPGQVVNANGVAGPSVGTTITPGTS